MTLPPPFGQIAAKRPDAFRPCGFSPLRRFTPHASLGSIAPRNRTGFAAFPNELPSNGRPKPTTDGSASLFPATRFTPLEEYPSSVAVPRHRGRCPLAVLSPSDRPSAEALEPTVSVCRQVVASAFLSLRRSLGLSWRLRRRAPRVAGRAEARAALAGHIPTWLPGKRSPSLASPSAEADGPSPLHRAVVRSEERGPSETPRAETLGVKSVSHRSRSRHVPRIPSRFAACSPAGQGRLEPSCTSPPGRSRKTIHEGLRVRVRVATRCSPEGESLLPRRPTNNRPKPTARSLVFHRCVAAAARPPPKRRPGVQCAVAMDMSLHPCHRCGPDQESPSTCPNALSSFPLVDDQVHRRLAPTATCLASLFRCLSDPTPPK